MSKSYMFDYVWMLHLKDRAKTLGNPNGETQTKTESIGRTHLLPAFSDKKVSQISTSDWQSFIDNAKSAKGQPLSAKTLSNIRSEIMLFCKFAVNNGYMSYMPDTLIVPDKKTTPKTQDSKMTPQKLKRLLNDEGGDWYINSWKLIAVTGVMPGECFGLKWSDIDDEIITINRTIDRHSVISQKGSPRKLFLSDTARGILIDQKNLLFNEKVKSPWVFPDKNGAQPKPVNIYNHWYDYIDKYMGKISLMDLRSFFLVLIKQHAPVSAVNQITGKTPLSHKITARYMDKALSRYINNIA